MAKSQQPSRRSITNRHLSAALFPPQPHCSPTTQHHQPPLQPDLFIYVSPSLRISSCPCLCTPVNMSCLSVCLSLSRVCAAVAALSLVWWRLVPHSFLLDLHLQASSRHGTLFVVKHLDGSDYPLTLPRSSTGRALLNAFFKLCVGCGWG